MDEEFKQRIIQDLKKSGFGSEMKVIRSFLDRGWSCVGGSHYFDRDEQKTRDIDFKAHRFLRGSEASSFFFIVGEVKKSNKPWVVFRKGPLFLTDAWNNLVFGDNIPLQRENRLAKEMSQHSLLAQCEWEGYGIHESFKNPDQPSRWYPAIVASCKAGEHVLETESEEENLIGNDIRTWKPDRPTSLIFVKPVVILDGLLMSASLSEQGEIELEGISAAPLDFNYRSRQYRRESGYAVDIVVLEALDQYISQSEQRHQDIVDGIDGLIQSATGT